MSTHPEKAVEAMLARLTKGREIGCATFQEAHQHTSHMTWWTGPAVTFTDAEMKKMWARVCREVKAVRAEELIARGYNKGEDRRHKRRHKSLCERDDHLPSLDAGVKAYEERFDDN